jgi:aminoglycoside phosphotransferase (APT) family kinase protein
MKRPWEPEIVVDEALALELIQAQFPSVQAESLSLLGVGWDNTAYSVDGDYVFRFPRRQIAVPLLERENAALPIIAQAVSLDVPRPDFKGVPSQKFKWPFSGYYLMPGDAPIGLSSQERARLGDGIASFLRELHSINVQEARGAGVAEDTLGKLSLAKWIPQLKDFVAEFQRRGHELKFDRLRAFIEMLEEKNPEDQALHLVHGDFYFRHLLVRQGELGGVIDWGDVQLNSPAVDLSIAYTFLPAPVRERFFSEYGSVREATRLLAQMRAFVYGCVLLNYGVDHDDAAMINESLLILHNIEDLV